MFKTAFVSINLVGLALFPFLYLESVSVNHNLPSQIEAGTSQEVEIIINKGSITGPARLKLDFGSALGLDVEELESSGASYSFENNELLFIWYSIPSDVEIKLKYNLKGVSGQSGAQSVSGTFSYVDGDERKKLGIPSQIVELQAGENTDVVFIDTDETTETIPEVASIPEVTGNRTITEQNGSYIVSVTLNKENGEGFARLKETIPNGFTATDIETAGSLFTADGNLVKFLWTSMSSEETIIISYKLTPDDASSGDFTVTGTFSAEFLVQNDVAKKIPVAPTSFYYASEIASNVNETETTEVTETTETTEVTETETTEVAETTDVTETETAETEVTESTETETTEVTEVAESTSSTNSNVSYSVQIAAGHKNVSSSYFKKYGVSDKVNLESHEGWVKYIVGKYSEYGAAKSKRNKLSKLDLPGPFVTAYNMGERISVQEALMTSNQSWIK